jgi:hypothetical protein
LLRHDRPFNNCHLSDFTVVCYVDVYATLSLRHKTPYALLSHRNAHLPSVLTSITHASSGKQRQQQRQQQQQYCYIASLHFTSYHATSTSSITSHHSGTTRMSSQQQPSTTSTRSTRFMRGASHVNDPEGKLWAPARWIVQLIQYMIALVMLTLAEGFKAVFTGQKPSGRRRGGKRQ